MWEALERGCTVQHQKGWRMRFHWWLWATPVVTKLVSGYPTSGKPRGCLSSYTNKHDFVRPYFTALFWYNYTMASWVRCFCGGFLLWLILPYTLNFASRTPDLTTRIVHRTCATTITTFIRLIHVRNYKDVTIIYTLLSCYHI